MLYFNHWILKTNDKNDQSNDLNEVKMYHLKPKDEQLFNKRDLH